MEPILAAVAIEGEKREAIGRALREFIDIKYELSRYVDEELIDMGLRFDKALEILVESTGTADLLNR